jgi:predicted house-cleaning noncanonical NTP pyrophosphatase (MazG superfamily)|tara:strand:+ start:353 stop:808 length:456 start_codon:yes stop_codon:yes gene_type:complete
MKVEKLVEQRIEKHLDLGENPPHYTKNEVKVLNTNEVSPPIVINGEGEKDTDFQYARENMYDIIEKGRDAMEELLEIAKAEESPRAFEVFGQLLKNMSDSQEKLMELHQKKQKLENDGERQEVTRAQNVTNAMFIGSTAELLKLVKKETKK